MQSPPENKRRHKLKSEPAEPNPEESMQVEKLDERWSLDNSPFESAPNKLYETGSDTM